MHTKTSPNIRFAIIDTNMLASLGLQHLLAELIPVAETVVFDSVDALQAAPAEEFLHYFVSSRLYFEHAAFFRSHPHKSIVLVAGDMPIGDVYTLNVCQSRDAIVRDIMSLQGRGHVQSTHPARQLHRQQVLSPRETEVAILLCKGLINKEIADRLSVSLTTIITHRKNIMDKLHARSLADIITYCVVNGIVRMEEL